MSNDIVQRLLFIHTLRGQYQSFTRNSNAILREEMHFKRLWNSMLIFKEDRCKITWMYTVPIISGNGVLTSLLAFVDFKILQIAHYSIYICLIRICLVVVYIYIKSAMMWVYGIRMLCLFVTIPCDLIIPRYIFHGEKNYKLAPIIYS